MCLQLEPCLEDCAIYLANGARWKYYIKVKYILFILSIFSKFENSFIFLLAVLIKIHICTFCQRFT